MQSKELLLLANQQCAMLVLPLLDDLQSAPLVSPLPQAGNHAHWVLGHLTLSEFQLRNMIDGSANPHEGLQAQFGGGSQPSVSGQGYPAYSELLSILKAAHATNITWLEGLSESDLDQPSKNVPPGFEPLFGTWRQALLMRALHWMNHRGQLADCRQAAGRAPLMA